MKNKVVVILEIILLFIMAVVVFFKDALPNYKKTHGSSDYIINTRKYNNMIEWDINNKINFSMILDEDGNVYHIMFFSKEAICLYNQNIEKSSLEEATSSIINILIENNDLKDNSNIKIIKYNSNFYEEFHNYLTNYLNKYIRNIQLEEKELTLQEKAIQLQMENVSNKTEYDILWELEDYSRNYIRTSKSTKQKETTETDTLTEESFKSYADNIYQKINNYKEDNQIKELEKDNTSLIIQVIPADVDGKYYPSSNSWYYIQNGKIYAYIEFSDENEIYGYCYQGTIESRSKGVCK